MTSRKRKYDPARLEELLDDAWLNIPYVGSEVFNPLLTTPPNFEEEQNLYILWLLTNPDYFCLFCKEILNITLLPFQAVILREMWDRRFPILIGSRGLGKSWLLALYAMLRMLFMPGRKIVITGAGFRQSKIIFEYMEKIWYGSPLLRDIVGDTSSDRNGPTHSADMWRFVMNESQTVALPIGSGEKIRGQRAHDIIVDEFAVGDPNIFEHVISGFAAVSSNVVLNVQNIARRKKAELYGIELNEEEQETYQANQIILSGTAYYSFNHFHKYWRLWQNIINSRGDKKRLLEIGAPDVNYLDYCVMRIPYCLIPEGFMEEAIVARSRSTMHSALYNMEFEAVFGDDSNGFFKRTLIEGCVDEHSILFEGLPGREYVIAVDPAAEGDNFCIIVLEVEKTKRRIVSCWTTNRKLYNKEAKDGLAKEDVFYDYAASKILHLVDRFKTIGIAIDTQGGGHAIIELLHSSKLVNANIGQIPIWKFIDKDDPSEFDAESGLHIIEGVNFSDSEYVSAANHGMRLDFENKTLLFPKFDGLAFAELDLSIMENIKNSDLMENAIIEVEELKNELSSIIMTQTPTGKDKWDTPDEKLAGAKKGRMRKDRYSALLMANALAKKIGTLKAGPSYDYTGGFANYMKRDEQEERGVMYSGSVLAKRLNDLYSDL